MMNFIHDHVSHPEQPEAVPLLTNVSSIFGWAEEQKSRKKKMINMIYHNTMALNPDTALVSSCTIVYAVASLI